LTFYFSFLQLALRRLFRGVVLSAQNSNKAILGAKPGRKACVKVHFMQKCTFCTCTDWKTRIEFFKSFTLLKLLDACLSKKALLSGAFENVQNYQ